MAAEKILIVDDNEDILSLLSSIVKLEGYKTDTADNGRSALEKIRPGSPDLMLLDVKLPDMDGMDVLEKARKASADLPVIMITAFGDVKGAVRAMKLGAYDYITKPFDNDELMIVIREALQKRSPVPDEEKQPEAKRGARRPAGGRLIGKSRQVAMIHKQVDIVAPTDVTVLIQGESGTGKEVVARLIHEKSRRKNNPFLAMDCGAIPETLSESELFGYEKGAFSGAGERKEGKFELANGGTLFFDEIANLPLAIQPKLLRVIQEKKLQHLGGKKDLEVDVRIIAASNIDLHEASGQGKFRQDLFHRLNEFSLDLPPLRERKDDIPELARHFAQEAGVQFEKQIKGISPQAMELLLDYYWPGNIRELRNAVRRAVLLTDSDLVAPESLSSNLARPVDTLDVEKTLGKGASYEDMTNKFERDLINNALSLAGGNKTKAAKILGVNRKALYRKMKSLGI
ncbi:MAG: sigma-54 dependent transcriptional regulator [Pseudomonadota bacterium]